MSGINQLIYFTRLNILLTINSAEMRKTPRLGEGRQESADSFVWPFPSGLQLVSSKIVLLTALQLSQDPIQLTAFSR